MPNVLYFVNPVKGAAAHIVSGELGWIDTPQQGNRRPPGVTWCADNGCYSDKFDQDKWWTWLQKQSKDNANCRFATAPDVVGNHEQTLHRSLPWLPRIKDLGYPAAFVAQDGATPDNVPWEEIDALFLGGTTIFKLGPQASALISEARRRNLWVHAGRVNSKKRYFAFAALGCDSCDGTYLTYGPQINLPKLLSWVREYRQQHPLFEVGP